jgi:PPOX class probable F420-dependent enzyme
MSFSLSDATLRLLDGRNYAVLATINPDGSPHTSAMWIGRDGNDLLFSTVQGRVKYRNMLRDPRVSVTILESANPENYVELRGMAVITPDPDRRLHIDLARKHDRDPGQDVPGAVRAIVRVTVHKATGYSA